MGSTEELFTWIHEKKCQKAVESLTKNGFVAQYCPTPQDAFDYIIKEAADAESIGFGGSMSIVDLGIEAHLLGLGKKVLNAGDHALTLDQRLEIMQSQLSCSLFLSGCNALTLSGELVNIDGVGNRVAAMSFGPSKVIVVAGRNKLVDGTVEDAITRIKNWATPPNAKRLHYDTPCAATGFCGDCDSPDRLCRITTVIDRNPRCSDVRVLVVNADMGF